MARCVLLRSVRSTPIGNNTLTIRTFLFSPQSLVLAAAKLAVHGELLRLIFLQAHRETEAHFNAPGMSSQNYQTDAFRFKRAAFLQSLKSKIGLAASKAAALRINLNIQGCGIVAAPVHAPSHAPLLLPLLLSHPRSLVRDGQTSPLRPQLVVSRSTCPPLSPSPHANSFVIGTAVINTHIL